MAGYELGDGDTEGILGQDMRVRTIEEFVHGAYTSSPGYVPGLMPRTPEPTTGELLDELGRRTDPDHYRYIGGEADIDKLYYNIDPSDRNPEISLVEKKVYDKIIKTQPTDRHSDIIKPRQNEKYIEYPRIIPLYDHREESYPKPVTGPRVEQLTDEEIAADLVRRAKAAREAGQAISGQYLVFVGKTDLNPWDRPGSSGEDK